MTICVSSPIVTVGVIVALIFIMPLISNAMRSAAERARKKSVGPHDRTYQPKGFAIFFLVTAIVCAAAMTAVVIALAVTRPRMFGLLIGVSVAVLGGIGALAAFGYANLRFCYEMFDDEKVTAVRFGKRKTFRYEDMAYCLFGNGVSESGVTVYDKDGVKLFSSDPLNIGLDELIQKIKSHGVTETDINFITRNFGQNPNYVRHKKRAKIKLSAWICFGFAAVCFGLFAMLLCLVEPVSFAEHFVSGEVKSIDIKSDECKITLGDESEYYLSSVVLRYADKNALKDIKPGDKAEICVGYVGETGKSFVFGLTVGDKVCLSVSDSEEAENRDYRLGLAMTYGSLGIASALLLAWAVCLSICRLKYPLGKEN